MNAVKIRRLLVAAFALALVAAPVARLAMAAPCAASMDCCAGSDRDDTTSPCGCTLQPVTPAPAALDAAHLPAVVLAEAPLAVVKAEALATAGSAARVAPRARSAPLHLLHSALLV